MVRCGYGQLLLDTGDAQTSHGSAQPANELIPILDQLTHEGVLLARSRACEAPAKLLELGVRVRLAHSGEQIAVVGPAEVRPSVLQVLEDAGRDLLDLFVAAAAFAKRANQPNPKPNAAGTSAPGRGPSETSDTSDTAPVDTGTPQRPIAGPG